MKRVCRSLVYTAAVVFPFALLAVGAAHEEQPFTLAITPPKQPLKAGKPLILCVTVKNLSERSVHVSVSQGSVNVGKVYEVHVLDEEGRPAPRRPHPLPKGKGKFVVPGGSIAGSMLDSGESLTDQVNVTYLYDLSQPGKYKIWIAEPFYRGPHLRNGLVKSNTITVTVIKSPGGRSG